MSHTLLPSLQSYSHHADSKPLSCHSKRNFWKQISQKWNFGVPWGSFFSGGNETFYSTMPTVKQGEGGCNNMVLCFFAFSGLGQHEFSFVSQNSAGESQTICPSKHKWIIQQAHEPKFPRKWMVKKFKVLEWANQSLDLTFKETVCKTWHKKLMAENSQMLLGWIKCHGGMGQNSYTAMWWPITDDMKCLDLLQLKKMMLPITESKEAIRFLHWAIWIR